MGDVSQARKLGHREKLAAQQVQQARPAVIVELPIGCNCGKAGLPAWHLHEKHIKEANMAWNKAYGENRK